MVSTKSVTKIDKFIGKRVYQLRMSQRMSRQKLASKIGVTRQQCQKYEAGIDRIAASRLFVICKVLGVSIGEIFSGLKIKVKERGVHQ